MSSAQELTQDLSSPPKQLEYSCRCSCLERAPSCWSAETSKMKAQGILDMEAMVGLLTKLLFHYKRYSSYN